MERLTISVAAVGHGGVIGRAADEGDRSPAKRQQVVGGRGRPGNVVDPHRGNRERMASNRLERQPGATRSSKPRGILVTATGQQHTVDSLLAKQRE